MISVNEAKRLIKRTLLANIVSDKPNLALTPLVSEPKQVPQAETPVDLSVNISLTRLNSLSLPVPKTPTKNSKSIQVKD